MITLEITIIGCFTTGKARGVIKKVAMKIGLKQKWITNDLCHLNRSNILNPISGYISH